MYAYSIKFILEQSFWSEIKRGPCSIEEGVSNWHFADRMWPATTIKMKKYQKD